ncbi:unnamed protein product, partial [Candidula unifasciata]
TCFLFAADNCTLEAEPGFCFGNFPRYFYNIATAQCEQFIYGGCQGNGNNFELLEECQTFCMCFLFAADNCTLEAESGICRGNFPRYFYNIATAQCEQFIFGGCQGNGNNFELLEECQAFSSDCTLEPELGLCKGHIERYFYNITTAKCETFFFGGCGTYPNNFEDAEACQAFCV